METQKAGLILGVILLIVGVALVIPTEEAGEAGTGASGGTAEQSEDVRPYLIPGAILAILGLIIAVAFWAKGDEIEEKL